MSDVEIIAGAMRKALQGEPAPACDTPEYTALMGALHRAVSGAYFNQIGIHAVGLMLEHTMAGLAGERAVLLVRMGKGGAS